MSTTGTHAHTLTRKRNIRTIRIVASCSLHRRVDTEEIRHFKHRPKKWRKQKTKNHQHQNHHRNVYWNSSVSGSLLSARFVAADAIKRNIYTFYLNRELCDRQCALVLDACCYRIVETASSRYGESVSPHLKRWSLRARSPSHTYVLV